jgi:hypothetical protein
MRAQKQGKIVEWGSQLQRFDMLRTAAGRGDQSSQEQEISEPRPESPSLVLSRGRLISPGFFLKGEIIQRQIGIIGKFVLEKGAFADLTGSGQNSDRKIMCYLVEFIR